VGAGVKDVVDGEFGVERGPVVVVVIDALEEAVELLRSLK